MSEAEAQSGVTASSGRLVLPVIAGRPAAAYFTVRNDSPEAATITGVQVSGAGKAEMHKTEGGTMAEAKKLDIAPGGMLAFAPGGLHVMVFDVDPKLKAGTTGELTLTFANGNKVSVPLVVEVMGSNMSGHDMSNMEGMSHEMPGMQH